jgi:hypothetical protein
MAKQKITGLSASLLEQAQPAPDLVIEQASLPSTTERAKTVVQTVKVPPDVFIQLKTVGARQRRSSQDIILSALREYLDHHT